MTGFAAETENLEVNARTKLENKGCDLIVANDVSRSDIGFDSEENEALLVFKDRTEVFDKAPKHDLAMYLVSMLGKLSMEISEVVVQLENSLYLAHFRGGRVRAIIILDAKTVGSVAYY